LAREARETRRASLAREAFCESLQDH
jgi:hypothetical protein